MTTYRVGTHHGVTINREGDGHRCDRPGHDCARGHLVGVMLTAEDAALVVEALNEAGELRAIVVKAEEEQCGCLGGPLTIEWAAPVADSCTGCTAARGNPDCPVHQGRRARGPKPPPSCPVVSGPCPGDDRGTICSKPCQANVMFDEWLDVRHRIANRAEHRPSSLGGDGLGYGPCVGCSELWPCQQSRRECPL